MTEFRRVLLRTGVTLNVALAGDRAKPPVILLHGFPESHRTWRELARRLDDDLHLVMPDQRGFAGSDRPQDIDSYKTDLLVDDLFALADALSIDRFALVGHDWGGAVAWSAALRNDRRLTRLAIINAPHPVIFQKTLIESEDQRSASQYINAFRAPGFAKVVVPPPGVTVPLPDFLRRAFGKAEIPTLVVWGMRDTALLPIQLEGLDRLVADLTIARVPDAGHFIPWEAPEPVVAALRPFLAADAEASACAQ